MKKAFFTSVGLVLLLFLTQLDTAEAQDGRSPMDNDLRMGNLILACGGNCAPAWDANVPQLVGLYRAGQWQNLAAATIRIGYGNDLAYFFLGTAAEGMGYADGALRYYRYSATLGADGMPLHHCRESAGGCGGIDLQTLLSQKIAGLSQQNSATPQLPSPEQAEIQSILYAIHANALCSWPLSPIVGEEMRKYVDY